MYPADPVLLRRPCLELTHRTEFNIFIDPEAVQVVYDFEVPVVAIPLNVTHETLFHHDAHRFLLDPERYVASSPATTTDPDSTASTSHALPPAVTPLRRMFSTLLTFFAATYEKVFNFKQGPPIHDALVISYITDPNLFTHLLTRVDIDRNAGLSKGAMIVDVYDNAAPEDKNVKVAQRVDVGGRPRTSGIWLEGRSRQMS